MVPLSAKSARSLIPSNLKTSFPNARFAFLMLTVKRILFVPRLGTTPGGLTTVGFSPRGSSVTAFSASISATAPETNSWCSNAESAFFISLEAGVVVVQSSA